jgi:hypothetical protein
VLLKEEQTFLRAMKKTDIGETRRSAPAARTARRAFDECLARLMQFTQGRECVALIALKPPAREPHALGEIG